MRLEIVTGGISKECGTRQLFTSHRQNPIFPRPGPGSVPGGALWLHTWAAPFHEREASSSSVRGPRSELWERALAQRSWAWARASARQDWATGWTFCKACDRNWKWTCITVRKHRPSTWKETTEMTVTTYPILRMLEYVCHDVRHTKQYGRPQAMKQTCMSTCLSDWLNNQRTTNFLWYFANKVSFCCCFIFRTLRTEDTRLDR